MELDFDKEMDALLRKSATRGVLVGDTAKLHLDADAIAAFAENALPQKSREIHTRHLAECDPCRKTLSTMILMNAEAERELAAASVAPPVMASSVPWYRKLFTTPNLAYTFGGLILIFGGMIGFVAIQNMSSGEATVSQVQDNQTSRSAAPVEEPMAAASNANASANSATSANNTAGEIPRSVGTADVSNETGVGQDAPPPPSAVSAPATGTGTGYAAPAKPVTTDGLDLAAGQPAPKEVAKSADEERKGEDKRAANEREAAKQEADNKNVREQQLNQMNQMTPGAGNRKDAGPSRVGVQRDNRAYDDSTASKAKKMDNPSSVALQGEADPVIRTAGGKKFEQRQGVWYDTAYRGQSTKNIRRGTDDYRKLDGGLRSIADSLGGTVVVVWNGKPYRIH